MTSQWDQTRNENNPTSTEAVEMKTHDANAYPFTTSTTTSPTRIIQKKKHSYHLRDDYLEGAVAANVRTAGSRRMLATFSHPQKVDHPNPRRYASWPLLNANKVARACEFL